MALLAQMAAQAQATAVVAKTAARTILHIDLDAFYASVEEHKHPSWKGKPLIVGADPKAGRGVVATCNYAARRFGVRSAMPIRQAQQACPQAIFVKPDMALYCAVSGRIMKLLRTYATKVEQASIDEAYLDSTGVLLPGALAQRIKDDIARTEGITCSIGIGSNKLIAKIASDLKKPDGLVMVTPGTEKRFLAPLPVRKLIGVGEKTEQVLYKLGIRTIGQLALCDQSLLLAALGRWGCYLYAAAHGQGDDTVSERVGESKSMSRNVTFHQDTSDFTYIQSQLALLANRLAGSLAHHGSMCKAIGIRVRFEDFATFSRVQTQPSKTQDAGQIRKVAWGLLQPFLADGRKLRLIGIRLSSLTARDNQQKRMGDFLAKG